MKKALAITLACLGLAASPAVARAGEASISTAAGVAASAPAPQWQGRRDRWDRRNRRAHVYTQTRLVRYGRRIFRETYQIRYLPNGRTVTRLISRVRVR